MARRPGGPSAGGVGRGRWAHRRLSVRAARNRSFSSGRPTVTRRQPVRPGHSNSLARAPRRSSEVGPHLAGAGGRWAGTGGSWRPTASVSTGSSAERGGDPAPLLGEQGHPGVHLVDVVEGQAAGQLLDRVEVVGQRHQLAGRDHLGVGRPGSRAGAPAIDQVLEKVRTTTTRSAPGSAARPGRAPRTGRTARRPRPPPAGPGAIGQHARRSARGVSARPVGLLGEHRKVRTGSTASTTRAPPRRGRARSRRRACPAATAVPVIRAMWRVQRVGGLEQRHRAARAAVGQQQALQHLVRAVGAEDLSGPTPWLSASGPAELGGLPVRDSG